MTYEQKAVVVWASGTRDNVDSLNECLDAGWRVVSATPMGGAAYATGSYSTSSILHQSLVIIERSKQDGA